MDDPRAYAHYRRAAMYDALGKSAKAAAHLRRGMELESFGVPRQLLLEDAPKPKLVWTKGTKAQHRPRKAPVARGPVMVAAPRQWGEIGGKFTYPEPESPEPEPVKPTDALGEVAQAYKTLGALPNRPRGSGLNAKERYMKLALQLHPDKSQSAAGLDSFRTIQEAWETLEKANAKFGKNKRIPLTSL